MKTRTLFFLSNRIHSLAMLVGALFVFVSLPARAITLTGSNGRAAELLGIKDATPKGLTAQMVVDGPIIGIPWARLDLAALERDQKLLFAAYERTVAGETIPLNLGSFSEDSSKMADGESAQSPPRYRGWADVKVGERVFALQMPIGKPRGILLVSTGAYGGTLHQITAWERGDGPWAEFQSKYGLAILSYEFDVTGADDPRKMDNFAFAEKGSGQQVLTAILGFATKLKKPELVELPIAVCGMDRLGAAFAYHFALWKPEKILGAVISKGGFYNAEPSAEAAEVPMIFVWGQYSNNHELWGNENNAENILKKYASMKPNWTSAMEFKGTGRRNQKSDYFTKVSLKAILDERLPELGAVVPKAKVEPAAEGDSELLEEIGEPRPLRILPFDRNQGMVGNLKTKKAVKITNAEAALAEDETFVISSKFAGPWKQFLSGEFEVPTK